MAVQIGHASGDENRKAKGGAAGDQTGREVRRGSWYDGNWTMVFRAREEGAAEKIARAMEQACANECIGYDQSQRTTLYEAAKALDWDLSKIARKVETDCSALVAVCVNAAGIAVSRDMYTGNQEKCLRATGKFEILKDALYRTGDAYLRRGDILLKKGHTAVALSDGEKRNRQWARSFDREIAGAYRVTASALNLRRGAGTGYEVLAVLPKGTRVRNYGFYTAVNGAKWLYIQTGEHTGFVHGGYLQKV